MDWKNYFENTQGTGFLATANKKGEVNAAIYSRPKVLDDGSFIFGMTDRLTHANIAENPHAVYAFSEGSYAGNRFYLEKTREEEKGELLEQIRKEADRCVYPGVGKLVKHVVYFKVNKALPLVIAGCTGDHSKHLCELAANGEYEQIQKLAKEPYYMCLNCGRMADSEENLCNPIAIDKIPVGAM